MEQTTRILEGKEMQDKVAETVKEVWNIVVSKSMDLDERQRWQFCGRVFNNLVAVLHRPVIKKTEENLIR